jgi:hypothetical protein
MSYPHASANELFGLFIGFAFFFSIFWVSLVYARLRGRAVGAAESLQIPFTPFRRILLSAFAAALVKTHELEPPLSTLVLGFAAFWLVVELPIRAVLIPAGLVRSTYVIGLIAGFPLTRVEARIGAAFLAAQALARKPTESGAGFVERRLSPSSELSPVGVAAVAFVALSRGDRERGLGLLHALEDFPAVVVPAVVASAVREILSLAAAERGAWNQVATTTDGIRWWRLTRLTNLLGALARRAGGEPMAPSLAVLWGFWALSPFRRQTLPLVRSSRAVPEAAPADAAPDLTALAALARRAPHRLRRDDLAAAARSLDLFAASPRVLLALAERAQALGVSLDAGSIRERIAVQGEEALAGLVLEARLPIAWLGQGASADRIGRRVRAERESRIARMAREIHRRASDEKPLPEADEYLAAGDLLRAVEELHRDALTLAHHETLFRAVHRPLWSYGYWLAFRRSHRKLARVVFARQRELALAAHARETYDTIDGNLTAARRDWSMRHSEASYQTWTAHRRQQAWSLLILPVLAVAVFAMLILARLRPPMAVFLLPLFAPGIVVALLTRAQAELGRITDGIVLQFTERSYFVRPDDGLRARAGPFGLLFLTLERSPWWLPRRFVTTVSSPEEARRRAVELNEMFRAAR